MGKRRTDEQMKQKRGTKTCVLELCGIHVTVIQAIHSLNRRKTLSHSCTMTRHKQIVFGVTYVSLYMAHELKLNTHASIRICWNYMKRSYTANGIDLNALNIHTCSTCLTHHDSQTKMLTQHVCTVLTFCASHILLDWIKFFSSVSCMNFIRTHTHAANIWNGNSHAIEFNVYNIHYHVSIDHFS